MKEPKTKKGNIDLKLGFWTGKMEANPKIEKQALEEISKLEIEKRKLLTK